MCGSGQQHPRLAPQRVQRIAFEIVSSGVGMAALMPLGEFGRLDLNAGVAQILNVAASVFTLCLLSLELGEGSGRVALQASSHVEGDVHHMSLAIEQCALFEGRSRRAIDVKALNSVVEGKSGGKPAEMH